MPTSKNCLPDVNCWLAAAARRHSFHVKAKAWMDGTKENLVFCRVTQMAFLRLITNPKVMGLDILTSSEAWETYEKFLADPRIVFVDEPVDLEKRWKKITSSTRFKNGLWTDAYLAAFAQAGEYRLVTFDQDFARFADVDTVFLGPASDGGKSA